MSVITLVVAVAILGAGVVAALVRRRRRRRDGEPRAPLGQASIEANIPTFRIVALGLQGSGKTLLLASMFQELKAPTRQSYYLSAPPADVARLTEWYSTMADTSSSGSDRDWPYGTAVGDTRRFLFSVRTRSGGVVHEVLRLDYLEYAGELLTGTDEDGARGREELFAHMESAHALLGILDGQRIRRHLDGHPGGWAELDRTLNILIPHMMNATCPIHFVITKWDLLDDLDEDENARLAIVRNMLMSNDHFRALVGTHSRDRVVRLIPVSAVGPGFARMDGQGHVVKVPHAQARPVYVDVPLSAVVPDLFDQAEMRLQAEFKAALDEETRRRTRQSPWRASPPRPPWPGRRPDGRCSPRWASPRWRSWATSSWGCTWTRAVPPPGAGRRRWAASWGRRRSGYGGSWRRASGCCATCAANRTCWRAACPTRGCRRGGPRDARLAVPDRPGPPPRLPGAPGPRADGRRPRVRRPDRRRTPPDRTGPRVGDRGHDAGRAGVHGGAGHPSGHRRRRRRAGGPPGRARPPAPAPVRIRLPAHLVPGARAGGPGRR
ncbi:hypothetical protein [Thermocatellispora tengchongensis]|uniref:hypothetical protein n=1 Tax=Thermocatellispora tengchongensis TaxID=1073253 RepID=UPI003632C44B